MNIFYFFFSRITPFNSHLAIHTKNILLLKKLKLNQEKQRWRKKMFIVPKRDLQDGNNNKNLFSSTARVNNGLFENKSFASWIEFHFHVDCQFYYLYQSFFIYFWGIVRGGGECSRVLKFKFSLSIVRKSDWGDF